MIPNRLSERSFRYYEPVIKQVVDTFPNEVRVKPVGLSINTYVARLRDAMLSYNTYRWESNINFGLFQTYYGTFFGVRLIQVHIEGDTVVIGSKKQKDAWDMRTCEYAGNHLVVGWSKSLSPKEIDDIDHIHIPVLVSLL